MFLVKVRNTKAPKGATTKIVKVIEADVATREEAFAFIPEGKAEYSSVEEVSLKRMYYVHFENKDHPSEVMAYDEDQAEILASEMKSNKDLIIKEVTLKKVNIPSSEVDEKHVNVQEDEDMTVGEEVLQLMWDGDIPFVSHMNTNDLKTIVLMKGHFMPLYIDELANSKTKFTELEKALLALLAVGVNNPNLGKKLHIDMFDYWSSNEGAVAITPFGEKAVSLIQKTAKQREQNQAKRLVSKFK